MKRNATKRWVGACLLGSALATGCNQTGSRVDDRPPWVAHPYVPSKAIDRPMMTQRRVDPPPTQLPMNPPAPLLAERKVEEAPAQPPVNLPAPETLAAAAPEKHEPVKESSILQTALDSSKPIIAPEPYPARKAFVDTTALPCFSHAEDYSSLSGQLQHTHKGWRLRYASVDETDTYGGSVTLRDESRVAGMNDGDLVRVHGRLFNPDDKGIAPSYEIMSIQAVNKRE
jgi:hypothetical protein